jgi:hypothetical protein
VAVSLLLATACGGSDPVLLPGAGNGPDAPATVAVSGPLIIVLPPADGLAEPERARVRMLVDRALEGVPATTVAPLVLEPATSAALADTVELALRRAGADGTVCVLGTDAHAAIAAARVHYPAPRTCALPPDPSSPLPSESAEDAASQTVVDLELLGRELGAAARATAGTGTVLVLSGGDVLLDRRWRTGIVIGAAAAPGTSGAPRAPGVVHTVLSAAEVLAILDEQAALLAEGIVPGGPGAVEGANGSGELQLPEVDDVPIARQLPPVGVVVLDASPEALQLVTVLADRGMPVIAPRSLLLAAGAPEDAVVLRWRVRWDVALGALLRALGVGAPGPVPSGDDLLVLVLEAGPAYVGS